MEQLLDKIRTPKSRAGDTVERIGKVRKKQVTRKQIADQMSANSKSGISFDERDVVAYEKLFDCSQKGVLLTARQARELMAEVDQAQAGVLTT